MLDRNGGYRSANSLLRIRETERVLRVSGQAFGVVFAVTFFLGHSFPRGVLVFAILFVPLLLVAEKQFIYVLIRNLHTRGHGVQNVLIYGAGFTGRRLFSALVRSPKLGLNPVAIVDDDSSLVGRQIFEYGYKRERSVPVVKGPLTGELIREHAASLIVVGIPSLSREGLNAVIAQALTAQARVAFVPQLSNGVDVLTDYVDIDGVLIASLGAASTKLGYETAKRVFDFVCVLGLMLVTAPVWAVIAALIRRDSPGPIFFKQTRVGLQGRMFRMYKFRSMYVNAPQYDFHPTDANDPRITRMGRWLRRTSLDELPQLLNILKGEMSLVGPRPEMPFIVERYNKGHQQRLKVIPGLTGLWQLSADRAFLIHENIHYDLYLHPPPELFYGLGHLVAYGDLCNARKLERHWPVGAVLGSWASLSARASVSCFCNTLLV
jgi:exopolysaccharide biosynthesis polyprenyl glycosylphosphotransferase